MNPPQIRAVLATMLPMLLAACASYHRLDLPAEATLAPGLASLHHDGVAIDRPLSVDDVAALAVQNDPSLLAERRQRGLAEAQVLQAGLLPNPSLGPTYQFNTYAPNAIDNAWTVALTYDFRALLLRPSLLRSAKFAGRQIDAQLLWQEWQVIGQARLLAVDLIEGERQRATLGQSRTLLADRYRHTSRALAQGNATLTTVIPDLGALQAAGISLQTLERTQQTRRQQLDALLGLRPTVVLALAPVPVLPPFDPARVRTVLPELAAFRPDLVALQMGYRSEDARVRAAIIGQFPTFMLSLIGGIDNTRDYSVGPQPTLDIPIFNHNQGQIAIERATRALLHDQYDARLAAAESEVLASLASIELERRQLDADRRDVALTARAARDATRAWQAGDLDELTYTDLVSVRIARQLQILDLEQAQLDQQVAVATLTGAGLPPMTASDLDRQAAR